VVLYDSAPIEIIFVCGYGDAAADVPIKIRQAIKVRISDGFEYREDYILGVSLARLSTFESLLDNYRLNKI
jgi:hypothetical protein